MDNLSGLLVAYYQPREISDFFRKKPEYLNKTKGRELFVGFLLTECLENEFGERFQIGLPLKNHEHIGDNIPSPPLDILIKTSELIDDRDFDIVLNNKSRGKGTIYFIQITRLTPGNKTIYDAISKKLNVPEDKKLILVVSVEDEITINLDDMRDFINSRDVPYGLIFLVGNTSAQNQRVFRTVKIYPDVEFSTPVVIDYKVD